jgi:hypothetical protein
MTRDPDEQMLPMDQPRYRSRIRGALCRLGAHHVTEQQVERLLEEYGRSRGVHGPAARLVARRAVQMDEVEADGPGTVPLAWIEAYFDR